LLEKEHKLDLEKVERNYLHEIDKFQLNSDNKIKEMNEENMKYRSQFEELYNILREENNKVRMVTNYHK